MPAHPSKLTPPMNFHMAVLRAQLPGTQKAVCWSLLGLSDWQSGDGINASIGTIACGAGLGKRATTKALAALADAGAVIFERRSSGGMGAGGGIVHELRLDLESLEELSHAPRARLNPAPGARSPCTKGQSTAHQKQSTMHDVRTIRTLPEKKSEQPPQPDAAVAAGGGGCGSRAVAGEEESQPASNLDHLKDTQAILLAYGVSATMANELAWHHGVDEVREGMAWCEKNGKSAGSKPGLLVTILRDGTAANQLGLKQQAERKAYRDSLLARLRELERWSRGKGACPTGEPVLDMWRDIHAAWDTADEIFDTEALGDDLLAEQPDGWALLRQLHERALGLMRERLEERERAETRRKAPRAAIEFFRVPPVFAAPTGTSQHASLDGLQAPTTNEGST
jgi:hypothetical protein